MKDIRDDYFLRSAAKQERWRLDESINLLPSENIASKEVRQLLSSDFGHRYTLPVNAEYAGEFLENSYRGTKITTEIESVAEHLVCQVFKSKHACVQPLSGHIAAMIVIRSLMRRGDTMISIRPEDGGYDGYSKGYLPDLFGLEASHLPFDEETWNIDAAASARKIKKIGPRLVILGGSFILFPYQIAPIKEACEEVGAFLAYDGSHVLGLLSGGRFQDPLREGADVVYGSTHKSFFGPQGGLIFTNDEDVDKQVRKNLTWRIVDNIHWNRVAALGQSLLEAKRFGKDYAGQVIKNSKRLGKELEERDFPVRFPDLGFSESHQLLIDKKALRRRYELSVNDFSVRLEKSNIITDSVARLGTAEITRIGIKEKHIPEIADFFMKAAMGSDVKREVGEFRARFSMDYCF